MSQMISCPFCNAQINVDERASAVICMSCGKSFSLGIPQQSNLPPQQNFAMSSNPGMPQMPPVNMPSMCPKLHRPQAGLFVAGTIFNILAFVGSIFFVYWFCSNLDYCDRYYSYYGDDYDVLEIIEVMFRRETFISISASIAGLFMLTALVLNLVSIAKYWSLLPPQIAKVSPAEAVVFLLIPFFNLYWVFVLNSRLGAGLNQMSFGRTSVANFGIPVALLIFLGSSVFSCPLLFIGYLLGNCAYYRASKIIEP